MAKQFPHFTECIFYSIEQIARYLEVHGKDFFGTITGNQITAEEYRTLDVIVCNPDICQRDLAKLILRDRVRTGRILDSLEHKELIQRYNDVKNNRLVKKFKLTSLGEKYFNEITNKIQPYLEKLIEKFTPVQAEELQNLLNLLHDALSKLVKVKV